MRDSRVPFYAAILLALMGLLLVFGPLFHLLTFGIINVNLHLYNHVIRAVNMISLPIVGVVAVYLSIFVYHRRLFAVYISAALSIGIVLYLLVFYPHGLLTIMVGLLSISYNITVFIVRKSFTIKNNLEGLWHNLRQVAVIMVVGFIYGVIGFYFFGNRLFHAHFSFITSIGMTLDSLTGFSGTINGPYRFGHLFIDSLGGIGIVIFMILLGVLFRPLRLKVLTNQQHDMERAEAIIRLKSKSSEDFFKLWPHDKQYYFSDDLKTFITYKQSGRTIIVLDDPVGQSSSFQSLIASFTGHCDSLGWFVAVINASNHGQLLFEKVGLSSIFIGNEGVVNIDKFVKTTKRNKHFRYVSNRARRDKLAVAEWDSITTEKFKQLHKISNEWLGRGNRREYTFFMGYFDHKYLDDSRIFVLLENNEPVAYVNLIPSYYPGHASLDQFRSKDDISPAGMHFLLMKVIEKLHEEHTKTLNIGLSPLSGIENSDNDLLASAALRVTRFLGTPYYSFAGLEQFKNKFEPIWEPRSLLFTGSATRLVRIIGDIERASIHEKRGERQIYISTVAGVAILTLGLYFILG